jgi:uroporphyrin-III C-methyltransferase
MANLIREERGLMKGKVYLVGAGPGDPELLTLKALRLLQTAQAVLHDDLVAPEILQLSPSSAQLYNVGKRCGKKRILQGDINALMVALAETGLRIVRLKGGDPLIFGRAGEEIEALRSAKVPFEIVPGVTSTMGAAAGAEIPLTHRRGSDALVLITAHLAPESKRVDEAVQRDNSDWRKLATSGATLAIYMPGQNYTEIAQRLRDAGLAETTPCAVISRATTKFQRTHRTILRDLHRTPQLVSPTLLIVGEVVGMANPTNIAEFVTPALTPEQGSAFPANLYTLSRSTADASEESRS